MVSELQQGGSGRAGATLPLRPTDGTDISVRPDRADVARRLRRPPRSDPVVRARRRPRNVVTPKLLDVNVVFAGTPEVALPSLEALLASEHRVLGVLTRPDAPTGRGRKLRPSPVAQRALDEGLPVLRPDRPRGADFLAELAELGPDCVPIVAYGALIPQPAIDLPRHGWVNLHFSLLPAWRGAAPVQHAIRAGDAVTGATTFSLVAGLDAGPVYDSLREPIGPSDTAGELLDRLAVRGADLLAATLTGIEAGRLTATPQPTDGITQAPKVTTADAAVDWTRPASELDRLIRSCTPAPGAWTTLRGDRFKIITARPAPQTDGLEPGEIAVTRSSVRVGAGADPGADAGSGAGSLELLSVQPPGKRPMAAADWARGAALVADERFGR